MKAVRVHKYGTIDQFVIEDIPRPTPEMDDLLVEVKASSINPIDWKTREGKVKVIIRYNMPYIPGSDVAGIVVETGSACRTFKKGDRIFARVDKLRLGGYAEYCRVRESDAAGIPDNVTFEEAAGIPLTGLTSYQAMVGIAGLKKGQKALIHAGAGGVGTFAVQLAKVLGAEVWATASPKNFEMVQKLGADHVVDYKAGPVSDHVKDMDFVFDTIGGATLFDSFRIVKRGGTLVSIAAAIPDVETMRGMGIGAPLIWAVALMNGKINRLSAKAGITYKYLFMHPSGAELSLIAGWMRENKIKPVVDRVFPLDQIKEAFAYAEEGHAKGKVIIKVR